MKDALRHAESEQKYAVDIATAVTVKFYHIIFGLSTLAEIFLNFL